MVIRSLVGAFAAVAAIGSVAAVLPERGSAPPSKSSGSDQIYGRLAPPQFVPLVPTKLDAEHEALLKLAAYSVPADPAPASSTPPVARADSAPRPATAEAQPPAEAAVVTAAPVPATASVASAEDFHPDEVVQTPLPPAAPTLPQVGARRDSQVNINRAPVSILDRLPGAGRIGFAIARRRPYRSVDDLVTRRVLRKSALARIRPFITAD